VRRPSLPIALFLLATVSADLAVVGLRPNIITDAPMVLAVLLWSLYFSQIALMAIWLALGGTAFPLRLAALFFVLLKWSAVVFMLTEQCTDLYRLMVVGGIMSAVVAIPLLAARSLGLRLVHVRCRDGQGVEPSAPERYQYSMLSLFGLVTVVAVLLGMTQYTSINQWGPTGVVARHDIQILAAAHGATAWFLLWIALGSFLRPPRQMLQSRRVWIIVSILIAVGVVLGVMYYATLPSTLVLGLSFDVPFFSRWLRGSSYHYNHFPSCHETISMILGLPLIESVPLLGSLLIFRLAGYRLMFGGAAVRKPQNGQNCS
jgi:hypothetical protein